MLEFITEKFYDIVSKCLDKKAKELNTEKINVQLVFKLGESGEAEYHIFKEYKPTQVLTFLEVLGVRIDFKGYSFFVPNFIKGSLNRFCESDKIDADKVSVVIYFQDKEMVMWLYNGGQYVKQIDLESLFNTEDILSEQ
jgi:hypothetical protein